MNTSPRKPSFKNFPKNIFAPKPRPDDFIVPQKSVPFPARWNSPTSGGGGSNTDSYRRLSWGDITWGDIYYAYSSLRPQLMPSEAPDASRPPFESTALNSAFFGENQFCLIKLKPLNDEKPIGVFGRVRSFFPAQATIKDFHQVEVLISFKSKPIGLLTIGPGDVEVTQPIRNWYFRLSMWGTADDFDLMEGEIDAIHKDGFELSQQQDADPIEKFYSMDSDEKKRQPWVYIIGSSWLSRLEPLHQIHAVAANLRHLLDSKRHIIINFCPTHPNVTLNHVCNLLAGRDKLFYEARNYKEIKRILNDAFPKLLEQPLEGT